MSLPNTAVLRRFVPVYEGWGADRAVTDFRDQAFVDCDPTFSEQAEAKAYSERNTGAFPYATTGQVALVEITVRAIKIL